MDNNNKKNNADKTINFAEKKRAINNKKNQSNQQKNISNDNRVIKYDINKMREQINQKYKSKNTATSTYSNWVKYVYLFAITLFVILLIAKVTSTLSDFNSKNKIPNKFITQSTSINSSEVEKYETTIDTYLNTYIKVDGKLFVKTTTIHKNDKYVYASGYFLYPHEDDKIYFDAVMIGPDKMSSLVVNGYDLTK